MIIRQGKEENYRPSFTATDKWSDVGRGLKSRLVMLENFYPGLELKNEGKQCIFHTGAPKDHGHPAGAGEFLEYGAGRLPWEVPNMITNTHHHEGLEFATRPASSGER